MYTGAIFPNKKHVALEETRVTSLGVVSGIHLLLRGAYSLTDSPQIGFSPSQINRDFL
jgi:hypothetical protein